MSGPKVTPMLFQGEMIRALLAGRKTQTRRIISPQPQWIEQYKLWAHESGQWPLTATQCRYGGPGDLIYARETWGHLDDYTGDDPGSSAILKGCFYRADYPASPNDAIDDQLSRWRPSIFMPRWANRITGLITEVRPQRVQDISDADSLAEGVEPGRVLATEQNPFKTHNLEQLGPLKDGSARGSFANLWDSINGKPKPVYVDGSIAYYESFPWDGEKRLEQHRGLAHYINPNPWVWALTLDVIQKNIDDHLKAAA